MTDLPPAHRPIVKLSDVDPLELAVGIIEALKEVVFALTQPAARSALQHVLEARAERLCEDHSHSRGLAADMLASALANTEREKSW